MGMIAESAYRRTSADALLDQGARLRSTRDRGVSTGNGAWSSIASTDTLRGGHSSWISVMITGARPVTSALGRVAARPRRDPSAEKKQAATTTGLPPSDVEGYLA